MKKLHKLLCLFLSFVLSTYTLPVFAATVELSSLQSEMQVKIELTDSEMQTIVGGTGSVDATMSEYIRYDPTSAPKAEAVVSNRSTISLPYILEVMDINGVSLEVLASGTLAVGETKIITGVATVANRSSVRVKVGGDVGLVAIDTAYLITKRQ